MKTGNKTLHKMEVREKKIYTDRRSGKSKVISDELLLVGYWHKKGNAVYQTKDVGSYRYWRVFETVNGGILEIVRYAVKVGNDGEK